MNTGTENQRDASPSDDPETAEASDDLERSQNAAFEQRESARRDEQVIDQFRENLASNLRRLRTRENWTQTDLGNRVGLSQSQIGFLERKKQNIGLPMLIQLSRLFNVEPMELLSNPDDLRIRGKTEEVFSDTSDHTKSYNDSAESSNIEIQPFEARVPPEHAFFGTKLSPSPPQPKPAMSSIPMEAILGSPDDPLDLAVVSRIIGAAYKRVESLRHKHGSVPMTRAMLLGVLAAVLNASHDADDECIGKESLQLKVDK